MPGATPNPTSNPKPEDPAKTKTRTYNDVADSYGAQSAASNQGGGAKDPRVLMAKGPFGMDMTLSLSMVAGAYYSWGDDTKNKFLSQLNLAGYDTNGMKDAQIAQLWGSYAAQAAEYYARGTKVTPWDILAKDREQREAYMRTPRSVTQSSTAYDMSTREDAHGIFLQAAQSLLGRDPTKSEITAFQKALNAYEKANPTVTTTTTNYMGDDVTGQTSTTKGGVKEGARGLMAMEDIKKDPEYGAYQAATTYFDAMMEMIGG